MLTRGVGVVVSAALAFSLIHGGSLYADEAPPPPGESPPANQDTVVATPASPKAEEQGVNDLMTIMNFMEVEDIKLGSFSGGKINDSASAVSVVTREIFNSWGPMRPYETLRFLPGVFTVDMFDGLQTPVIRSIVNRSLLSTAISFDGAYFGAWFTSGNYMNPLAIERMEVLRGPSGTLYGSDAFAGLVGVRTWDSVENRLEVEGGGGMFGDYQVAVRGHYNLTENFSLTGIVAANGQGDADVATGYANPATGQIVGMTSYQEAYQSETFILKAKYADSFEAGAYFMRVNTDGWPAITGQGFVQGDESRMRDGYTALVRFSAKQELGAGLQLHESLQSAFGWSTAYFGLAPGPVSNSPLKAKNETAASFAQGELRLSQQLDTIPLEWNVAYQPRELTNVRDVITIAPAPPFAQGPDVGRVGWNHGIVLDGTLRLFDRKLNINGGVRWDYFAFGKISNFTGNATVGYTFIEDTVLKAVYNRGFRAPDGSEYYGEPGIGLPNYSIKPETLDTFELVFLSKSKLYKLELAAYYELYRNQINYATVNFYQDRSVNEGTVDGWGIEGSGALNLDPVAILAAVTYGHAHQDASPALGIASLDLKTQPSWMIDLGAQVKIAVAELSIGLFGRALFDRVIGPQDNTPLANYFHLDANVTWAFGDLFKIPGGKYDLYFLVNNVTNVHNAIAYVQNVPGVREPGTKLTANLRIGI